MNCDRVFDILTRGPFPTGERSDIEVERHLAVCTDCYRLAEALRPALELFQEAVSADESRDLPGYWGEPLEAPSGREGRLGQLVQAAWPRARRGIAGSKIVTLASRWQGWRLAAALLLGFSLGLLLVAGLARPTGDPLVPSSANFLPESPGERASWAVLKNFNLAPACLALMSENDRGPGEVAYLHEQGSFEQVNCCTQCHGRSRGVPLRPAATAMLAQRCAACHR